MKTKIVGICNVTPDSFSDGGRFYEADRAIEHVEEMFAEGADLVDIGAESTRPGATPIDYTEEWRRLGPVVERLGELGLMNRISIDTQHITTVHRALLAGATVINDISGSEDVLSRVLKHNVTHHYDDAHSVDARYVLTHLPERTIEESHRRPFLGTAAEIAHRMKLRMMGFEWEGIATADLIIDPGIGFGKRGELNEQLLRFAELMPNHEVMIGYSRKKFLGEHCMDPLRNVEAGVIAMQSGAAYLRVHDVAEHAMARDALARGV